MTPDNILYGGSLTPQYHELMQWAKQTEGLHAIVPDFHRLQIEHWIWSQRAGLGRDILDVGVDTPRRWLGAGYRTFGLRGAEDLHGDLCQAPLESTSLDGVVLTEVLEHCVDPRQAVAEVHRLLRPGGLLLVTSPFWWPDHRTDAYADYWRFTEQGWRLLLAAFVDVSVTPCQFTREGLEAYHLMRRFECMGFAADVRATTGYLCTARKEPIA